MDFKTLHKQRLYLLIAAAAGVLGMILPWVRVCFMNVCNSVNGLHGEGFLILFAFIGIGALAFLGDQTKMVAKNAWLGILGCGALAALLIAIFIFRIEFNFGTMSYGFWLATAAAAAALFFGLTMKDPKHDLKQSLSEMKKNVENKLDNDPNT